MRLVERWSIQHQTAIAAQTRTLQFNGVLRHYHLNGKSIQIDSNSAFTISPVTHWRKHLQEALLHLDRNRHYRLTVLYVHMSNVWRQFLSFGYAECRRPQRARLQRPWLNIEREPKGTFCVHRYFRRVGICARFCRLWQYFYRTE